MKLLPAARVIGVLSVLISSELFLSCGGSSTSQGGETKPRLTQIIIAPANPLLTKGTSQHLSATGIFDDGTQHALGASVTWQTSQSAVATINTQGDVSGVGEGVAQVSAAYQGVTGSTSVTVGPPALLSITVSPNQSSLALGESEQLTATGNLSDGTAQNLTQSATWSSSGSAIASVSPAGAAVANAVGTATISATSGSVTGSASLTVTPAAVIFLNINPATLSIGLGSSRQFQAIATLSDGTTQDLTGIVAWSSTQPAIASVSSGGLAIAEQVGSTTILAEGSGLTGSADLSVMPLIAVNYFDRASAEKSGADGTVRLTNPGSTPGGLCAMVYVFDQNQALNECCGCSVTDSGMRSISLLLDLSANPLTGNKPQTGVIKVVPSDLGQNPQCDPGSLAPAGVILGWGSNVQVLSDGTFQVTETRFEMAPLNDGETTNLVSECNFLKQAGSGKGICSCGSGD
jgi:hypothetical protein